MTEEKKTKEELITEELVEKVRATVEELDSLYTEFHYNLNKFYNKKYLTSLRRVRRVTRSLEQKLRELRKAIKGI